MKTGAVIDGNYRYSLWRSWDDQNPRIGFIMLNPSRADAVVNDPTIRRCLSFAQTWGYGGLEVVNLFAYRTASPIDLRQVSDPVGTQNDHYLVTLPKRVDRILLAWGNWGYLLERDRRVLALLGDRQLLYCLGITKTQQPRHPLYLKATTLPQVYPILMGL
ncbi:DUF1643 domain-containing protein [Pantanalinema sp. GBBB05]|uniref:DUF1643 domain-containing protein n=1 Tax=Pantanalinema sp. GBBB05 TaxID=2604139 RepID=UPI001DAA97FB|nr:DUF1643 domain-containing protein [Pantanalinema sp. GBBB05]